MSRKYPIVAVTGSSGSGITTASKIFARIFRRLSVNATFIHGNSFRKYSRIKTEQLFAQAEESGKPVSHFGPEINLLNRLEGLFREFSRSGTGCIREYVETAEQARRNSTEIGNLTPWKEIPEATKLLFYEGHHGGCVQANWSQREMSESHNPFVIQQRTQSKKLEDSGVDIAKWVDLLIGIVPCVNIEWIQKIDRSCRLTGCTSEEAVDIILRRMRDYITYITPQFSLTDINFQRIPLVDTSNPFIKSDIPNDAECMVVIRFREPSKHDLVSYTKQFPQAFLSRPNTLVIPNGYMEHAIDAICSPLVRSMLS